MMVINCWNHSHLDGDPGGEQSNYDWTVLSVLLPAQDCSQMHTLLCLSHSPCKPLAMHCFGGLLPLSSWFQCVRADQDRARQAGAGQFLCAAGNWAMQVSLLQHRQRDCVGIKETTKTPKLVSHQRPLSWHAEAQAGCLRHRVRMCLPGTQHPTASSDSAEGTD